jgi:anti-sigma factor RsiW
VECRDVHNLLHPFVDGELDLVRHLQIEHHLADCSECAERERSLRQLRTALSAPALYYSAPDSLRAKLESTLAQELAPPASAPAPARPKWRPTRLLAAAAASVLLVAGSMTAGAFLYRSAEAEDRLVAEVVAGHVRSLQVAHATDVASSNQHTVKPWFLGRVPFAPQVPDLSANGFVLVGGRLDFLADRPVAALVYRRRDHVINVFTWSAEVRADQPVRQIRRHGFQLRSWQRSGTAYWAVSDLNGPELDEFVRFFQDHTDSSH